MLQQQGNVAIFCAILSALVSQSFTTNPNLLLYTNESGYWQPSNIIMHKRARPIPICVLCSRTLRADVVLSFSGVTYVLSSFFFVSFSFLFSFIKAEALRSTVPRYACDPAATRSYVTIACVLFCFVYFLFLSWRCPFFRVAFCIIAVSSLLFFWHGNNLVRFSLPGEFSTLWAGLWTSVHYVISCNLPINQSRICLGPNQLAA